MMAESPRASPALKPTPHVSTRARNLRLVSYPNFLPATLCLLFLLNLRRTYSNAQASRRGQSAVHSRPSFTHVVCSLLPSIRDVRRVLANKLATAAVPPIVASLRSDTLLALHRPHGNRRRHGLIHSRHAARRP
jgi:hypothetical protein